MERDGRKINVYVMIGLPGAGKDTWIKENLPDAKCIVCRDDIRVELGLCGPDQKIVGTKRQEEMVTGIFYTKLKMYAREGEDIVINNINLKRQYRMDYHKVLQNYDVNWIYVIVEAPNLDANKERRKGQIPPEVLDRLAKSYEPPTPDEYDEIIYVKQEKI